MSRELPRLALRVTWHIHDDAMPEADACLRALLEWPRVADETADRNQVVLAGTPRMRVVLLSPEEQRRNQASRAVLCDVPVIRRRAAEEGRV